MRKALSGFALLILSLAFIAFVSEAAQADDSPAKGKVAIVGFHYNANGADTLANRWKESLTFKNVSSEDLNVTGWRVHDTYKDDNGDYTNQFVIPQLGGADVVLKPGESVLVTPADGSNYKNATTGMYVFRFNFTTKGYHGHIWNNMGDTAFVEDKDHKGVTSYQYDFTKGYYLLP